MPLEKRRSKSLIQPPGTFEYVVQEKDTLRGLAAKYDVNLSILKTINKLMTEVIFPDQVLYIPTEEYIHQSATSFIPAKNNEQKPGHAERLSASFDEAYIIPPRPLSNEEVIKIDEECHHKFVKIKSICLTDDGDEIPGILLITPDGVMFDPDSTDPVVMERGPDEFQLVDSIMSVISAAVYHDETLLAKDLLSQLATPSTVLKQPPHPDEVATAVTFPSNISSGVENKQQVSLSTDQKFETTNNTTDDKKIVGYKTTDPPPAEQSTQIIVSDPNKIYDNDVFNASDATSSNKMDSSHSFNSTKVDDGKVKSPLKPSTSCDGDTARVLRNISNVSAASSSISLDDQPTMKVFLRLKVHKNIDSLKNFRVSKKTKNISRLEYWFAVPNDKNIDQLYAFFKKWTPSMANASDSDEAHFVVVESDSPVANVIDQSNDLYNEIVESLIQWKKRYNFKKDWEIVSVKEYRRLTMVVEIKKLPLPELSEESRILTSGHVGMLTCNLPALAEGLNWCLMYSTEKHGFSLNTLYRKLSKTDLAFFLVVLDTNDNIFGALVVGRLKMSDHFYGSGESYLFTFYPEFKRFNWTGINNFFIKGSHDSLVFGASEGNNGLWLDADLYHGRTQACQTFDNEVLTSSEDFVVKCVEVWSFI
ncbi:hypothetical protein HELRODRAFT_166215 [Helobdella robusta]|uniref:Oxidation resistance protein 1 n=1 Tax=Helobdella robusta TaxID=6412 RepID=T1EXW9_HELRO|nr:hypothetical protein HELRODRAFT_166215 [Helobdella robusta]ESN90540.1 hypothetical protein HELRODRAFT_166215 [Helobdella robusta]